VKCLRASLEILATNSVPASISYFFSFTGTARRGYHSRIPSRTIGHPENRGCEGEERGLPRVGRSKQRYSRFSAHVGATCAHEFLGVNQERNMLRQVYRLGEPCGATCADSPFDPKLV